MTWLTWEGVGVDRMACAWLIRRFVDPMAEFAFIPAGAEHDIPGVTSFDIPGVRLSHRGGHCTFHTILDEYRLEDAVLHRLARIVDEADIAQEIALEPAAPGLDLICRGLRRTSPDDLTAIDRGALVYDALYAELKSES